MKIKYLKNITRLIIVGIIAICSISCENESDSPVLSMTAFQTYIDDDGQKRIVLDSVSRGIGIQGRIYVDGGAPITARGVCWKIKTNGNDTIPTINNDTIHAELGIGTGLFRVVVDGLMPDTIYYMRTFAVNADNKIGYGWVLRVSTYEVFN